jgi:DNA processing protein
MDREGRAISVVAASTRELALAVYAAARDAHLVEEPREQRFARFVRGFDGAGYQRALAERGVRWVGRSDEDFPLLLRAIHDPPPGLFLRGAAEASLLSRPAVAVVGARACSGYGASVARGLGRDLAAAGLVVVGGLARGVDGEAHRGALEAGGATIAILGCGIDRDYPAAHRELAARICAADGLVAGEYPPGVAPAPWRFPARNRIVAGLCSATIVVEARERSGALITADLALEEGRDVFAVPGEITAQLSKGANALLRLGAIPLTHVDDVLEHLGVEAPAAEKAQLGAAAEAVLARLRDAACPADELARATRLAPGAVAAALVELELAGHAREAAGVFREVMRPG